MIPDSDLNRTGGPGVRTNRGKHDPGLGRRSVGQRRVTDPDARALLWSPRWRPRDSASPTTACSRASTTTNLNVPAISRPAHSLLRTTWHQRSSSPPDGTLLAALGAPSSNRISSIITNVISNLVDRQMGLEEAIEAPRVLYGGILSITSSHPSRSSIRSPTPTSTTLEEYGSRSQFERYYYPIVSRRCVLFGGANAVGWRRKRMP